MRAFSEGEILAGRFRIIRFIARGGMGELYEAEDLELRESVAIKTIRPEMLAQPDAIARFKREVHLARKVTHPNVCRIFDLFRHRSVESALEQETLFISMELLHGRTLSERINESPKLSVDQALPLARQMASAIAAAHAVGIVHRDFKPGNVVLVEAARPAETRAVVTDFGLALQPWTSEETASTSIDRGLLGTPEYMSPGQVEGCPATAATDIYALGLVMYELVTGTRPFQGDTPMSAMVKRLSVAPRPPRDLNPELNLMWESVILRCLERDPAKRFANGGEVAEALRFEDAAAPRRIVPQPRNRRTAAALIAVLLLAAVGAGYGVWLWRARTQMGRPRINARRSIAVLGFKNLSGNPAKSWLSTALSEMLTTELTAGGTLRAIPGESVAQMKINLSLPDADSYGKETLTKIRNNLGSDEVVLGSYLALGNDQLRLDLRIEDATTGEIVDSVTVTGKEEEVADLVSRTGENLRRKLGEGKVSVVEAAAVRASLPSNRDATRLYSEGLAKLRTFDNLAALSLLREAVAAEPDFIPTHSALAEVWSALGYDEKAKTEAKIAFDLSNKLSQADRFLVEGRYRMITHEWDKAVEVYRKLFDIVPDDVDDGLRLARALHAAGRVQDALMTIDVLRHLPAPARDDARIDLQEALEAGSLGDNKRALAAQETAAKKAAVQGAKLVLAAAREGECATTEDFGNRQQAIAFCEEAKRLYEEAGDRDQVASIIGQIAWALVIQGDLAGAQGRTQEALSVFREVGDRHGMAGALRTIGTILLKQGDYARAAGVFGQTLAIYREIEGKGGQAGALTNMGIALLGHGDLAAARRTSEEAVAIFHELDNKVGWAYADLTIVAAKYYGGDLAGAKETLQNAQFGLPETGNKRFSGDARSSLGDILYAQGDLAGARAQYQEAVRLQKDIGNNGEAAVSTMSLIELSLDEGHSADLEELAMHTVDEFHSKGGRQRGRTVLARVLLAEGKLTEAQREINTAMLEKSQNIDGQLNMEIVAARISAARGRFTKAEKTLGASLAKARQYGFMNYQFEVRLAQGEIEIQFGKVAEGRANLAALQRDATDKGFLLIASKAAALVNR